MSQAEKNKYEDFKNPKTGRLSHLIPGSKRHQKAIDEGWEKVTTKAGRREARRERRERAAERDIEKAEEALEEAESYKAAYGSIITWGDKTYDLGTTEGWKAYRQALRERRSELQSAKRGVKDYRFSSISAEGPRFHYMPGSRVGPRAGPAYGGVMSGEQPIYIRQEVERLNLLQRSEAYFQRNLGSLVSEKRRLLAASAEAKRQGNDARAGMLFAESLLVGAMADCGTGLTFAVRPYQWWGTLVGTGKFAMSPEYRGEVAQAVRADPLGALISLPAAYLGGLMFQRAVGLGAQYAPMAIRKVSAGARGLVQRIPLEDPYRGMSALDRVLASQPYKVRPFLTDIPDTPLIQSPRLAVALRETSALTRMRPIPSSMLSERYGYTASAALFTSSTPPLMPPKLVVLLREARAASRLRPTLMEPYGYSAIAALSTSPTPPLMPVKLAVALREVQALTRLRPYTPSLISEKYGYTSIPALFSSPTAPLVSPRLAVALRELKAASHLRPHLPSLLTEQYGYTSTAGLWKASTAPLMPPKLAVALREAQALTRLRPYMAPTGFIEPKFDTVLSKKYLPTMGEQLKAITAYQQSTYAAKTEAFFRNTFKLPAKVAQNTQVATLVSRGAGRGYGFGLVTMTAVMSVPKMSVKNVMGASALEMGQARLGRERASLSLRNIMNVTPRAGDLSRQAMGQITNPLEITTPRSKAGATPIQNVMNMPKQATGTTPRAASIQNPLNMQIPKMGVSSLMGPPPTGAIINPLDMSYPRGRSKKKRVRDPLSLGVYQQRSSDIALSDIMTIGGGKKKKKLKDIMKV